MAEVTRPSGNYIANVLIVSHDVINNKSCKGLDEGLYQFSTAISQTATRPVAKCFVKRGLKGLGIIDEQPEHKVQVTYYSQGYLYCVTYEIKINFIKLKNQIPALVSYPSDYAPTGQNIRRQETL